MDTKSKSNKGAGILIVLLILAIASGIVYASYGVIYKKTVDSSQSVLDTYSFINKLYRGTYVMYWELNEKLAGKSLNPSDVILPGYSELDENRMTDEWLETYDGSAEYQYDENGYLLRIDSDVTVTGIFNQAVWDWQEYMAQSLSNLKYVMIDKDSGTYVTNYDDLREVEQENAKSYLAEHFRYVIRYDLNEQGEPVETVIVSDGVGTENSISDFLANYKQNSLENNVWNQKSLFHMGPEYEKILNVPKNVTVIYGVPKVLSSSDYLKYWLENENSRQFDNNGYALIVLITAGFVILAALLLPFFRRFGIGTMFAPKVPFEAAVTLGFVIAAMFEPLSSLAFDTAAGTMLRDMTEGGIPQQAANWFLLIFNMAVLMIAFGGVFLVALCTRQIMELGPVRYMKERSLTGRLLRFSGRKIKAGFRAFFHIDLTDSTNRLIFKIVIVNFIALALMCSIWFFGIGVLIAYSIGMFFVLRKYADRIKRNYNILLRATRKMSEGDLEVEIDEDVGLFNPLKYELMEIQSGFKKAVDEEVKSQNMKTELITNVSHDLKTPLTAIITYIDLMKDPNLTPEDRAQYLDTLERKSQRLKNLIEDLFEVSKASSRNVTLTLVDVDLCALLKQVEFELSDKIAESGIEFRFHMPEEKVIAHLDSMKTYRIFENLIVNITKYGMPGTRAYVDLADMGDRVSVTLKNISCQELDFDTNQITERFVRGDKSRNTDGSGLGLAIVKSFTELMGGTFEIMVDGDLFKAVVGFLK